MDRVEKTVFLCYRRTNLPWALAIYQELTHHGYDVFMDYTSISSGDFEQVILGNITARAHFLVLLTPSALERCNEPGDWLRREIETALESQRNLVPLMLEGFAFDGPGIAGQLTGTLEILKRYNGLSVPPGYFEAAMEKLRSQYLNVPLSAVLHSASVLAQQAATEQKNAANAAPAVKESELTAQQWFERGFAATKVGDEMSFLSEAIQLNPDYALAYHNRGIARYNEDDFDGAILDFTEAIRLKPDNADSFYIRGIARNANGDLDGAMQDFTEAIRLKPGDPDVVYVRGIARNAKGDFDGALQDFTEAIRLKPSDPDVVYIRGITRNARGDVDGALQDFSEAIRLKPNFAVAFFNRAVARYAKGDLDGALQDFSKAIRLKPDNANLVGSSWRKV